MTEFYDRQGVPIPDALEWASRLEAERRVASTHIDTDVWVSTVWLGLNHRFGPGLPLIFETMVFGGPGDQDCARYTFEDEALRGHEAMCAKWSV